jgi:hypothetical protein
MKRLRTLKNLTALVVILLTVMVFASCTNTPNASITPLATTEITVVSDLFANCPLYLEGMDLLDAYLLNTNQLTDEQIQALEPMVQEWYDFRIGGGALIKLLQGQSAHKGETYIQKFVDSAEYLHSSTVSGRVKAFRTLDVGIILVGIDTEGNLTVTSSATHYPKYLRLSKISANYKEEQVEGAIKLCDGNSSAMFFFPEEQVLRQYQLAFKLSEDEYPIIGTFLGKSQHIDNDSSFFLSQNEDQIYFYDGETIHTEHSLDGILVIDGVDTVKIDDSPKGLQGTFFMKDGREIKFKSYVDSDDEYLLPNGLIITDSTFPMTQHDEND